MVAKNRTNKIEIIRLLDAPVKMVWDAWNDPQQVVKWWGPRGFTLTSHKKDLRPGGIWHYTMHGPDGTDYVNKTKYHEVEMYSRLVYDHGGNDEQAPLFRVTANFIDLKGKTRLEMTMECASPEAAEQIRKHIKAASGNSTWDRLAEYLEKESTGKEKFVINRSFDAPISTMREMWTNPKYFSQWLAPTGFNMEFIKADLKTGGSTFYFMSNGQSKMYGKAQYLEISPNTIRYTQQFADEKGNVTRHPFSPTWPENMLTTIQLTEEGPDRTRVTVTWEPTGTVTPEELETFINARTGMTGGWTGSFDKLEEYILRIG